MAAPSASMSLAPCPKPGYPTGKEISKLLRLGLLSALSGNLIACSQQQGVHLGGAPLPPPVKMIQGKGK